jgi:RHS repeat-associated protein
MGWLTRAKGPWGTLDYAYDSAGNITLKNGATFAYKKLTNLLESTTHGETFAFDGAGNQTRKSSPGSDWTYRYNGNGRVKEILRNQQLVTSHLYDDQGNRLKRVDSQGNISRYISENFSVFESSGRVLLTKNITNAGVPVAAITTEANPGALRSALDLRRKSMAPRMYSSRLLATLGRRLSERADDFAGWAARNALILTTMLALLGVLVVPATVLLRTLCLLARHRARGNLERESELRRLLFWWRTDYLRRHPFNGSLVLPLIAATLLVTFPTPAYGDLGPGQGYPTPGTLFFVGDQINSTVLVTGPDGAETSQVEYRPYGEIDQSRSSGPNNFRPKFTSKEWDDSSNLYYYGARYYDPETARFLTPDPIDQFLSPYPYVDNDPVNTVDPDGQQAEVIVALIVIGAITGAYFGGAAVNHESNPFLWDWSSGRTLAGIFAGAAIGAAGGAIGGLAPEAGVAAGIVGEILVGAGENAAYTALGGGTAKDIAEASILGAGFGALSAGLGAGVSRGLGSRLGNEAEELAETGGAASRSSQMARRAEADLNETDLDAASFVPCSSFPAGTLVAGPQGLISIQSVRPGSSVLGVTSDDAQPAGFAVTETSTRTANRLVSLRVGNITLQATPEHPFWVPKKGWVRAGDLQPGDEIQTAAGTTVPVESVAVVDEPSQVYNFEVGAAHTYFVSPLRLLVHNPPPGKRKSCKLSELPPPKSQKTGKKAAAWQEKVEDLASEFGDEEVTYFDPPKGRRELDLEAFAFVEDGEKAVVSLKSFGKGSTRPQHFSFSDKAFGKKLGESFDRSAPIQGQYDEAMYGTWHHHPWYKTMAFVPRDLHEQLGHAGGFSKLFK